MGDTQDVDFNFSQNSSSCLDITPEYRKMCEIDSILNTCLNGQIQSENNVVDDTLLNSDKFELAFESPDKKNLENVSVKCQNPIFMLEQHEYANDCGRKAVEEFPDTEKAAATVTEQNYNLQIETIQCKF